MKFTFDRNTCQALSRVFDNCKNATVQVTDDEIIVTTSRDGSIRHVFTSDDLESVES
jgi:hypothetical protein